MSAEHLAMLTVFVPAIAMVCSCMIEVARERLHREPIEPPSPRFAAEGDAEARSDGCPPPLAHLARGQRAQ